MWIDAPDEQATEGRRDAIYAMEWAIELFATELNHAFAETGIGHSLGCQAGPLPPGRRSSLPLSGIHDLKWASNGLVSRDGGTACEVEVRHSGSFCYCCQCSRSAGRSNAVEHAAASRRSDPPSRPELRGERTPGRHCQAARHRFRPNRTILRGPKEGGRRAGAPGCAACRKEDQVASGRRRHRSGGKYVAGRPTRVKATASRLTRTGPSAS